MLLSTFQFIVTALLAIACARSFSLSEGEVPLLALMIPALWLLPKAKVSGFALLGAMGVFALTLPDQPVTLSVVVWSVFPLLMVMFSARSNTVVVVVSSMVVMTLWIGVMATQANGKLEGSALLSLIQLFCVVVAWWSSRHWQPTQNRRWWALLLLLPLWVSQWYYAVILALSITVMFAVMELLSRAKSEQVDWGSLMCWTLPTVAFASLMVIPDTEVPDPVFVIWLCLLATAWMTDYLISEDEESDEY
ncbi:hypothetical protein [Vibrio olivae]|uniref:Integral membrane protein n=1 Tax=Vibrio olivae TaxID=1243002 RepID=A0ABV5HKE5_9VIBR